MLILAICYVPFLAGAGVARAAALQTNLLAAMRVPVPAVISGMQWAPIGKAAWRY